jgi:hypothetical protein
MFVSLKIRTHHHMVKGYSATFNSCIVSKIITYNDQVTSSTGQKFS